MLGDERREGRAGRTGTGWEEERARHSERWEEGWTKKGTEGERDVERNRLGGAGRAEGRIKPTGRDRDGSGTESAPFGGRKWAGGDGAGSKTKKKGIASQWTRRLAFTVSEASLAANGERGFRPTRVAGAAGGAARVEAPIRHGWSI